MSGDGPAGKVYLDYNATTPLEPEVVSSIQEALTEAWGNPSSSHDAGKKARAMIDKARLEVARMIGAKQSDIIFTSGGTEADNMILQTAALYFNEMNANSVMPDGRVFKDYYCPHFITSHMEHPAVNAYLEEISRNKAEVTYAPLSKVTGRLEVETVLACIKPNTVMVTVMMANNETGIIQPVEEICKAIKSLKRGPGETQRIFVHTDAAQAIGKIPVNVDKLGVDYLTIVGHKFYGPRIGAVFARNLMEQETPLYPMLFGGGQEHAFRPGTENTGMIAGLGKACDLVTNNLSKYEEHMRQCRDYLESKLETEMPCTIHFNGRLPGNERLPNTCNVSLIGEGLEGHKVLSRCQRLQASLGAACHYGINRPSPILLALGIPEDVARNAMRLSLGRDTSMVDIDVVVADIKQAVTLIQHEHAKKNLANNADSTEG